MELSTEVRDRITSMVTSGPVVLFMKGSPDAPQCGFSARVIQVLNRLAFDYTTFDVLADGELRDGIKVYSDWPTIPQLYLKGEFQGGCDIVTEMYQNGELHAALGLEPPTDAVPEIQISDSAAEMLEAARVQQPGELHLGVDAAFRHSLYFGPVEEGEVKASSNGFDVFMDRDSAGRANGLVLDLQPGGAGGQGNELKIDNPNAPKVHSMSVSELAELIGKGADLRLYDVRTDQERAVAAIEGSIVWSPDSMAEIQALPKDGTMVFYCHHGQRSFALARRMALEGFTRVHNLEGGIDAWSREVDPSLARY
jgi:monothiol glutaredoxin